MKSNIILITTILILILGTTSQAQQYDCTGTAGQAYLITANSGLSMRAEPSLASNKVQAIPFGKEVMVCPEYNGPAENIEGVDGKWVKTFYRGKEGYMFDGFMEPQAVVEVIVPDSWAGEAYPGDKSYYGIYLTEYDKAYDDQKFRIAPIDFSIDTVQLAEIPPFYYAHLQDGDQPHFMISGLQPEQIDNISGKGFDNKFLYPGESVSLTTDNAHYHVYAKGRILENKGGDDINPIAMIKNYELHVRRTTHDGTFEDKVIYNMDISGWYGDGYEGGIFLNWIGDIDADGELDVLLTTASNYSCWNVVFFQSSKAEPGHFFKQVCKYQECDGC